MARPVKEPRTIESVLRQLQLDVEEASCSDETRRLRRAVLRGFRTGWWATKDKPDVTELAAVLRDEIFRKGAAT